MKTITLGDDDNPNVSIARGHISLEAFDKAFENEGWSADPWSMDMVNHEYWVAHADGHWENAAQGVPGAEPVTVGYW